MFDALLKEAELKRFAGADSGDRRPEPYEFGGNISLFRMLLQPFYPTPDLLDTKPREMQRRLQELRMPIGYPHFPSTLNEPAPNGVASMHTTRFDATVHNDQFYANGMLYHALNILAWSRAVFGDERPMIHLGQISMELFEFMSVAKSFYNAFSYRGLLVGSVRLSAADGHLVRPGLPGHWANVDPRPAALDSYSWPLDLDTHRLNDFDWLLDHHLDLMDKICWDLRLGESGRDAETRFLAEAGFIPSAAS